jgi:hypothetical protein
LLVAEGEQIKFRFPSFSVSNRISCYVTNWVTEYLHFV